MNRQIQECNHEHLFSAQVKIICESVHFFICDLFVVNGSYSKRITIIDLKRESKLLVVKVIRLYRKIFGWAYGSTNIVGVEWQNSF